MTEVTHLSPPRPQRRKRGDLVFGIVVAVVFVLHIIGIFVAGGPYWSLSFPLPYAGPYVWSIAAIGAGAWLLKVVFSSNMSRRNRWIRLFLAMFLVAFAIDTLTGGDYRWLELEMRWEMRTCGGPAGLQQWAQSVLTSPQEVLHLEYLARQDQAVQISDLPPAIKQFAAKTCQSKKPYYRKIESGGPWFMFDDGGWDVGWGVIVGKRDLVNPCPLVSVPSAAHVGWIKQLQPGVYLYAY